MWIVPTKQRRELRNVDDLFTNIFEEFWLDSDKPSGIAPVDVSANDENVYVTAELPGIDKKEVNVEYNEGVLTISGEKKTATDTEGKGQSYREIKYGSFKRQLSIGDVLFDKAKAEFKDGILSIELPKAKAQTKKLTF
jgi:HSP20 family protein